MLGVYVLDALACVVSYDEVTSTTFAPLNDYHSLWINDLICVGIVEGQSLKFLTLGDKLHFLTNSYNTSARLRFYILFRDIFALVIEKSVGISGPCHAPHVNLRNHDDLILDLFHLINGG